MAKPGRSGGERHRIKRGGAKRGTPDKASAARAKAVAAGDQTPLDFLLAEMHAPMPAELQRKLEDPNVKLDADLIAQVIGWYARRLKAAKAAAPYVHPRLSAHKVDGPGVGGKHICDVRVSFVE